MKIHQELASKMHFLYEILQECLWEILWEIFKICKSSVGNAVGNSVKNIERKYSFLKPILNGFSHMTFYIFDKHVANKEDRSMPNVTEDCK